MWPNDPSPEANDYRIVEFLVLLFGSGVQQGPWIKKRLDRIDLSALQVIPSRGEDRGAAHIDIVEYRNIVAIGATNDNPPY